MEQQKSETNTSMEIPKKMNAVVFAKAANAEDLKIVEWDCPVVKEDEVLVRIHAFGLNFADIFARKGQYDEAPPFPFIPGYEASGEVVAIGSRVQSIKVGMKVIAGCFKFGGYAQYVSVIEEAVVPLPEGWTYAQGAGILVTALTAYHCIYGTGAVNEGDRILVHAAAGGVGLNAVQIALHEKLEVYGTCGSDEKVKMLKDKGVHYPINYRTSDFETEVKKLTKGEGVDIIIDSIAGSYFKKDINILRTHGRVVGIGAASTVDRSIGNLFSVISSVVSMSTLSSIELMMQSKSFCGVNMKAIADKRRELLKKELLGMMDLIQKGVLKAEIHKEMSWKEIATAHKLLETRQTTGKIVMIVD